MAATVRIAGRPGAETIPAAVTDNGDGTYTGRYAVDAEGFAADDDVSVECDVRLHGQRLPGCPRPVGVQLECRIVVKLWLLSSQIAVYKTTGR